MKMKKQVYLFIFTIMISYGATLQSFADTVLPTSLSKATGGGVVNAIYTGERNEIVISDQSYNISPTLVVRSITGQVLGGLALLGPGKRIAYRITVNKTKGQGQAYLTEAWLLPATFRIPEDWQ